MCVDSRRAACLPTWNGSVLALPDRPDAQDVQRSRRSSERVAQEIGREPVHVALFESAHRRRWVISLQRPDRRRAS